MTPAGTVGFPWLAWWCCWPLAAAGGPKIVRVSGTVRYDDKPVPGVVVHFVPEEGRASTGLTDDQGRYKLSFDRKQEGAEVGTDKVYFKFWPRNPKEEMEYADGPEACSPEVAAVLQKYGDPGSHAAA